MNVVFYGMIFPNITLVPPCITRLRNTPVAARQGNSNAQTAGVPVGKMDSAILHLHRAHGYREPEAQPLRIATARIVQPDERSQHILQPLGVDAGSVIFDLYGDMVLIRVHRHLHHVAIFGSILDYVAQRALEAQRAQMMRQMIGTGIACIPSLIDDVVDQRRRHHRQIDRLRVLRIVVAAQIRKQ